METAWPVRAFGRWPTALRAAAIVVIVAVAVGALTSPAQQYLPPALSSLANAAGPWFVAILVAVRLGRSRLVLAILLGVAGFLLLNISYGVVSTIRGFPYSAGPSNPWTIVAIPAGTAVGVAVTWLGSDHTPFVFAGAAVPAVVLIAEGIYGLTEVLQTTGPVVWIVEIVGAVIWLGWVWWRR